MAPHVDERGINVIVPESDDTMLTGWFRCKLSSISVIIAFGFLLRYVVSMFKGRHIDRSVILLCVRWYLAYNLSLRNLKEMMAERGVAMDHSTVHRWLLYFSPMLLERFSKRKRPVTRKRNLDETCGAPRS